MVEEALQQRSKDKLYRGKKFSVLKDMNTREFAKLVKARSRRSLLRNYDVIEAFVKKCEEKESRNKPIKTHNRALVIVPALVGKTIGIHNGKDYVRVTIVEEMLGHRLGEFSPTRKPTKHGAAGIGSTKSTASKSVK
jgi:small subunit ribosomal protein S19